MVEIPREQWTEFLNSFSLKHNGWIADIELIDLEGNNNVQVREQPFAGVSPEGGGTGEGNILVSMGENENSSDPTRHLSHAVRRPTRIALMGEGADDLVITSEDGIMTVVRFREAVNPGKPSGIAA